MCFLLCGCGGVYDHQCDGSVGDVHLCPKAESYEYEVEGAVVGASRGKAQRGGALVVVVVHGVQHWLTRL